MKKLMAVLVMMAVLMAAFPAGAAPAEDFRAMTGLDQAQEKLDAGVTIDKVCFSNGYGFSTSEFTTADPEEIRLLWTALNKITVKGRVDESITDWYPQIVFYLSDGTQAIVSFEAGWLSKGPENYEIENAEEFWTLTALLVQDQEEKEQIIRAWEKTVDSGWEAAPDSTVTEEIRALFDKATEGLDGVNYAPAAYLGSQAAGNTRAVLCKAKTVYPDAEPRWLIVSLSEGPEGGVTVTDISDLNW